MDISLLIFFRTLLENTHKDILFQRTQVLEDLFCMKCAELKSMNQTEILDSSTPDTFTRWFQNLFAKNIIETSK